MNSKKTKFICFEGMDGSGKSTLSKFLSEEYQLMGKSVKYLRWLDGEDTFLKKTIRFFGKVSKSDTNNKQMKISNFHPIIEGHKNHNKNRLLVHIYVTFILINYLWYGLSQVGIARFLNKYDIFIIDRYYFDVIFSICKEFGYSQSTTESIILWYKKILPDPDLFIFILINPSLALERKPDEFLSIEQAIITEQWHNELFSLIEYHTKTLQVKFDNSKNINLAQKELISIVTLVLGEKT